METNIEVGFVRQTNIKCFVRFYFHIVNFISL